MTDSQSVPGQRQQNPELADFANFAKLPKKTKLLEKFKLPNKRGSEPTEKRRADSCPPASPRSYTELMSVLWGISMGQLGPAARLCSLPAPAHPLISPMWEAGESPGFLSNN